MRDSFGVFGAVILGASGLAFGQQTAAPQQSQQPWQDQERLAQMQEIANDAIQQGYINSLEMNSKFRAFGFMQFRWMYNSISPTGDGSAMGFSVRKAVLGVEGEVSDKWSYVVSGEWVQDTSFDLRDAYVDADFDVVDMRAGRFRAPFMAEWQVNEPDLLGNDYSVIAYTFGQGRSEGVQLSHEAGPFNFLFSYNNGFEQPNTSLFNNETWGLSGRAEWHGLSFLQMGAALAYNSVPSNQNMNWTVDGNVALTEQWFVFSSYTGRSDDNNGDGWGVLFQTGYDYDDHLTLFGQYEVGDVSGSADMLSLVSVGGTYAFVENVRWTTEVGYSFNGISNGWNVDQTGWSNTGTDGQALITTQLTVSF